MYHSIIFGNKKNTWDDWHLVPKSRPVVNPPKVKTNYVDIPGSNGSLDLTEAITSEPVYEDRTGNWTFIVVNGYGDWVTRQSDIINFLHGKRMKVVLEDDPDYYYEGRLTLETWTSNNDGTWSDVTIGYVLDPYKTHKTNGAQLL